MSASGPEPSWQLPLPPDSVPERRRVKPVHLLFGSLLALVLLCCGGAAAVEVFTGGKADKTSAAGQTGTADQPGAAAGNSTDPATPGDDPTTPAVTATVATPSATPKKTVKPKPTTPKPTTEPTTGRPTRTPTPTPTATTPTLPIVRAGAFCSPVGAFGVTAKGKLMRCTRESEDERPRWRAVQSQGADL